MGIRHLIGNMFRPARAPATPQKAPSAPKVMTSEEAVALIKSGKAYQVGLNEPTWDAGKWVKYDTALDDFAPVSEENVKVLKAAKAQLGGE